MFLKLLLKQKALYLMILKIAELMGLNINIIVPSLLAFTVKEKIKKKIKNMQQKDLKFVILVKEVLVLKP